MIGAAPQVLSRHDGGDPPGSVYVGRPSKWGNPYTIGPDGDRVDVIRKFRAYVASNPTLSAMARARSATLSMVSAAYPDSAT